GRLTVPLEVADGAGDVLIGLRQAGLTVASVSVAKPTLDEVFLALTGHDTGDADADADADAQDQADRTDSLLEV
ncbi:MAG TPA: hypothetical protein VGM14_18010, partial [Streptosporangiaceae bacterium]